jgi:hypothetical protein
MSLHIHRFIDSIKAAESRGSRDVILTLREAKDLHSDITKLLITLEQLRSMPDSQSQVVEVQLAGGSFKTT